MAGGGEPAWEAVWLKAGDVLSFPRGPVCSGGLSCCHWDERQRFVLPCILHEMLTTGVERLAALWRGAAIEKSQF